MLGLTKVPEEGAKKDNTDSMKNNKKPEAEPTD